MLTSVFILIGAAISCIQTQEFERCAIELCDEAYWQAIDGTTMDYYASDYNPDTCRLAIEAKKACVQEVKNNMTQGLNDPAFCVCDDMWLSSSLTYTDVDGQYDLEQFWCEEHMLMMIGLSDTRCPPESPVRQFFDNYYNYYWDCYYNPGAGSSVMYPAVTIDELNSLAGMISGSEQTTASADGCGDGAFSNEDWTNCVGHTNGQSPQSVVDMMNVLNAMCLEGCPLGQIRDKCSSNAYNNNYYDQWSYCIEVDIQNDIMNCMKANLSVVCPGLGPLQNDPMMMNSEHMVSACNNENFVNQYKSTVCNGQDSCVNYLRKRQAGPPGTLRLQKEIHEKIQMLARGAPVSYLNKYRK